MEGFSQEKDSRSAKFRQNGLSFNPTPMLLCNSMKNITLVYERMIKLNQSLVFQIGYLEFNTSLLDSIIHNSSMKQKGNNGLNIAVQYRFYPSRLNAQAAPFGLYLGPYASYYGLATTMTYLKSQADPSQNSEVKTSFNMYNLGIGIGYQFIFWDKLSVDLLAFGPSLTYAYKNKKYSENTSTADQTTISNWEKSSNSTDYPLLAQFIRINDNESSASFTTFFRYAITFGFRF